MNNGGGVGCGVGMEGGVRGVVRRGGEARYFSSHPLGSRGESEYVCVSASVSDTLEEFVVSLTLPSPNPGACSGEGPCLLLLVPPKYFHKK